MNVGYCFSVCAPKTPGNGLTGPHNIIPTMLAGKKDIKLYTVKANSINVSSEDGLGSLLVLTTIHTQTPSTGKSPNLTPSVKHTSLKHKAAVTVVFQNVF